MACISPPYSHHWSDPNPPLTQAQGGAAGTASRFSGLVAVETYAIVAASFSAWAHVGQDVEILPTARRITAFVTPTIEYSVKAESWLGSYSSAEALAHLILWNSSGAEVIHEVRSLFRAIAPLWWYADSGTVRVPVGIAMSVTRSATSGPQTWHIAFGLQAFAGAANLGGCHANASSSVPSLCVAQFDSGGNQIR
jgi:hypothetical protein